MPVIAVNLAAGVFADISGLVGKGRYASPEQFMEIAAFNQLALERGATPEELLAQGHRSPRPQGPSGSSKPGSSPPKVLEGRRPRVRAAEKAPAIRPAKAKAPSISAGALRQALERTSRAKATGGPDAVPAAARPANERVYGLVNRLFSLKLACRWILVANAGARRWAKHDAVREALAADAATIGTALEKADHAAGRKRDELLSTGLPRQGNMASQDRFLSQYVARTTRAGEIYPGAVCQFALASFDGDRLALTDRGLLLAQQVNPVLDAGDDMGSVGATLSPDERAFLAEQVRLFVPGELHDSALALSAVARGSTTPDELLASLRGSYPGDWTNLMLRSHVSGVVARLTDVGALQRRWEGRNVTYFTGPRGADLLATSSDGANA
ncbi:MAG: hypothetical protein ACRENE_12750 [Polyangiaceae bacterium]